MHEAKKQISISGGFSPDETTNRSKPGICAINRKANPSGRVPEGGAITINHGA